MTPAELEALGQKYYGRFWVKPLAAALPAPERTVYAWRAGDNPITPQAGAMLAMLERRLRRRKIKR